MKYLSSEAKDFDIVPTNIEYNYNISRKCIENMKIRYPFIETGIVGVSVLGKNIDYIRIGTGSNKVLINASHHGIEWITTPLVLKFCENLLKRKTNDTFLLENRVRDVLEKTSLYVIPMVNPDGVDLVNNGLGYDNPYYKELFKFKKNGVDFHTQWKANIRGVNLNRNYPADWENVKAQELSEGINEPSPENFCGEYALSEPETRALVDFTNNNNLNLTISYHTQGREIYWKYGMQIPEKSAEYVKTFKKLSGYQLMDNPSNSRYGGYKDWFICEHNKPGFTIEAGHGKNPLPINQFDKIYNENELLMFSALL